MPRLLLIPLLVSFAAAASGAEGNAFDGTKALLCVSSEAYDCSGDSCVETSPEGLDIPDLMRVDPAAKTITALDVGRRGESSEIASVQVSEGRLVLSGTGGEGRGWTFAIQRDTGDSVLTVNDASTALMIFGECTGA